MVDERTSHQWYERGYALRAANDLAGAAQAFEAALSGVHGPLSDVCRAGALRGLGELADSQDDFDPAIQWYREALALNPKIGVRKRLAALERAQRAPTARRRFGQRHV